MESLSDKVLIVTGASSGIGRAAALMCASVGAHVVACARRGRELRTLVQQARGLKGSILAVPGNVTNDKVHDELVKTALDQFGRLDGAFNNAGTLGELASIEQTSLTDWHRTIDTNLTSAMLAARAQIPRIAANGGGSVVFTGSFVGYTAGLPGMSAYAASKAGIVGLVKVLAVESAVAKVRVNVIVAGGTDTPMGRSVANTPDALAFVENLHAMKRLAQPEEIARCALFLLSDASSFMTGASMLVDGGVSISKM